ncbi:hypothetical protein BWI96_10140 [Siphonobacter sp. SORGH_AS_0500]|uniref:GNAT family N-acetyltransferase n=1 Tax=Siphonobacter sp. SORGH_AS_0500 TaxID=1864824 RepID=UPI000CAEE273|nr:GNAT family N-acetyltransferase [Siphonobacter sp. SORGH_AS_0500]PKK36730.1 hypothetical protein BWI96_10140 [Siphonobacter sp. SORGH_AS_0500]
MISYRQSDDNDFELTFRIKTNSTRQLVEKIWGWDNTVQLEFHKRQFDPNKIKIIINENHEVGYISTLVNDYSIFIESILIETSFQGKKIGTKVLLDVIKNAIEQKKNIELQVFKINDRAKKLYESLNFQTVGQTELHYKMRYEVKAEFRDTNILI